MKNPNQIRRDSSATTVIAQRKALRRRVKVRVSREFAAAFAKGAVKLGLTKSQFAELAIREELARSKKRRGRGVPR